jgi:hypothetical protein
MKDKNEERIPIPTEWKNEEEFDRWMEYMEGMKYLIREHEKQNKRLDEMIKKVEDNNKKTKK